MNTLSNASIRKCSRNPIEEEVIFFPFFCFEITQAKDKNNGKPYKEIHLKYLGKYGDAIKTQLGDKFLNKIINSKLSKKLIDF